MENVKAMKRNNILTYILFALTAVFPVLYAGYSLFLKGYTILFESLTVWADVLNVLLIGICVAMLLFKDKRIGKVATAMLILSVFLLPIDRYLMICVLMKSCIAVGILDIVIYHASAIIMIITACFYVKNKGLKILVVLVFSIIFAVSGFNNFIINLFGYQNPRVTEISAPDGIHHVRVIEFTDYGLYKVVYSYNSAESFSIGPIKFAKDWKFIEDYPEEKDLHNWDTGSLDENTDITFNDNATITIKGRTYGL